jgi:hypothetical protein
MLPPSSPTKIHFGLVSFFNEEEAELYWSLETPEKIEEKAKEVAP